LQIFNLFDEDGNGNISIEELLNLMAFFIEIGEGKEHKVSTRIHLTKSEHLVEYSSNSNVLENITK
jgi:Ca2+-binding EF-hand superfamily protein